MFDLDARQVDIKGAFLQAELKERIYMRQPQGYTDSQFPSYVYILFKSLYGLKQAGNEWWKLLRTWLTSQNFKPLNADCTIYLLFLNGQFSLIIFHVDDGLLAASKGWMDRILLLFKDAPFSVTDLGEPSVLLGCVVTRNRSAGSIKFSMPSYIQRLAERFQLDAATPYASPMAGVWLPAAGDPFPQNIYLEGVGGLNWCAVSARPDIALSVSHLASFSKTPSRVHWNALKRVIIYLHSTKDHGITYSRDGGALYGYSDADYANDRRDRRSITGWCFMFAGGPINWCSKKQATVSGSSMEAEYYATDSATREAVWLYRLFQEISEALPVPRGPIPIGVDNASTISFIERDVSHNRTKHIDTKHHFIREKVETGFVSIHKVIGADNPADVFTKPLAPSQFVRALSFLRFGA
jgi:hypothetical protein